MEPILIELGPNGQSDTDDPHEGEEFGYVLSGKIVLTIDRALKALDSNPSKIKKHRQNDYKRFIEKITCTADGEVAENEIYSLNTALIESEAAYDGFYAVCTNLDEEATKIAKINRQRWEIEECFRILKSEKRRQDHSAFYNLFHSADYLQNPGKETE